MNPALAARLPFEVLHGVGDVNVLAIDAGVGQRLVEKFPRRPDEWTALDVLLISRLFAYKNDARFRSPAVSETPFESLSSRDRKPGNERRFPSVSESWDWPGLKEQQSVVCVSA